MNTKRLLYILIPAIALAFGASLLIERHESGLVLAETAGIGAAAQSETGQVSLSVDGAAYAVSVAEEATVADVMARVAAESSLAYQTKEFPGLGAFVDEINGKRGQNGHYWILHINGKKSELGISQAVVRPGDRIEWRYEKGY